MLECGNGRIKNGTILDETTELRNSPMWQSNTFTHAQTLQPDDEIPLLTPGSETFNIICYLFFLLRSVLTVEGLLGLW